MNMHDYSEQLRQQLLDAAHQQYQGMVAAINRLFGAALESNEVAMPTGEGDSDGSE